MPRALQFILAVCHGTDAERTARVIVLGMVATDALAVVDNYVVVVGVRASGGSTCILVPTSCASLALSC